MFYHKNLYLHFKSKIKTIINCQFIFFQEVININNEIYQ